MLKYLQDFEAKEILKYPVSLVTLNIVYNHFFRGLALHFTPTPKSHLSRSQSPDWECYSSFRSYEVHLSPLIACS
ncbi:hypothetical protein [Trichormus sp. NMC-1]|uniref:hypothetical protein n=1 Tax=Trichormus sp. NMC-1 TaxID=1853259 RepID=UPI0015A68C99|nr:hypothetical protein [Trichormus sp. NMC-1]